MMGLQMLRHPTLNWASSVAGWFSQDEMSRVIPHYPFILSFLLVSHLLNPNSEIDNFTRRLFGGPQSAMDQISPSPVSVFL